MQLTKREIDRLPTIPPEYAIDIVKGQVIPPNVIYTANGGFMPALPADPDLPNALRVTSRNYVTRGGKLSNGLTRRSDIAARLVARGASGTAAYRAAYNVTRDDPIGLARHASRLAAIPAWQAAVCHYRAVLENESRQQGIKARDFAMSVLVREAQHAPQAAVRVRAAELIGKTEGMFVDVKRTEKTLAPSDLKSLKTQLEQRLMQALGRINPHVLAASQGTSLGHGTDINPSEAEIGSPEPHRGAPPLIGNGSHPGSVDSTPPIQPLHFQTPPSGSPGYIMVPAPVREMTLEDL